MKAFKSIAILILVFNGTSVFSQPISAFAPLDLKDGVLLVVILGVVAVYRIMRVLLSSE